MSAPHALSMGPSRQNATPPKAWVEARCLWVGKICLSSGDVHVEVIYSSISWLPKIWCICHLTANNILSWNKQLVMMKHSSVFINDAAEAGRLIKEMPSKGPIYGAFRYAVDVPDMLGEFSNTDSHKSWFLPQMVSNLNLRHQCSMLHHSSFFLLILSSTCLFLYSSLLCCSVWWPSLVR